MITPIDGMLISSAPPSMIVLLVWAALWGSMMMELVVSLMKKIMGKTKTMTMLDDLRINDDDDDNDENDGEYFNETIINIVDKKCKQ